MSDVVDPFSEYDAAYVMGALSPEDRAAFETHLASCAACTQAVAELSGLPGMLDKVPLDRVLHPGSDVDPPPDLLLPRLISTARTERRRRSVRLVASGAVAASLLALALAVGVGQTQSSPPAGVTVAMTPVRPAAVTASLQLTSATWGTRVSLDCRWVGATTGPAGVKKTYRLVAVPRGGGAEQVLAQWAVLPGQDAKVTGSTDLAPGNIASIELRAVADGAVLLRTTPAGSAQS